MGAKIFTGKYIAEVAKSDLIRVFVIENSTQVTGAFRSTHTFCHGLSSRFEFHLGVQEGCWSTHQIPNCTVHPFKFLEISRSFRTIFYLPKLLYNTIKLHRILARHSIQVVHVGDLYNMLGLMVKILNPGINLIYHVRLRQSSYVGLLYKFWIGLVKKYADSIVCVSQTVADDVGKGPKTGVIYDALPAHWLGSKAEPLPRDPILLLYVANYVPGKGHHYALEVLKKLSAVGNRVHLKFVGGDLGKSHNRAYLGRLEARARTLGIDHQVEFAGPVDEIRQEMLQAHIILNFSESESFSMVCLEALACEKPIIATRCGGPQEIIRHQTNGWLVNNKDVGDMTQAVSLLVEDQEMRKRFSSHARLDFKDKFNLEVQTDLLANIYLTE